VTTDIYDQVLTWVMSQDTAPPDLAKHQRLIEAIRSDPRCHLDGRPGQTLVVVGGAEAAIEVAVARAAGLTDGTIHCIDRAEPDFSIDAGTNTLEWTPGWFPAEVPREVATGASGAICLAASSYFEDAFDTYAQLTRQLAPGALVVLDFVHQPLIKRSLLTVLGTWMLESWRRSPEEALAALTDLANLATAVGEALEGTQVQVRSQDAALGLSQGPLPAQQMIYDVLFPLWYRPGGSNHVALRQLVWQLLYRSMDGTRERIEAFATDSGIHILDILVLTPSTNVLIGRTYASSASE
jgi:hypothetical protein